MPNDSLMCRASCFPWCTAWSLRKWYVCSELTSGATRWSYRSSSQCGNGTNWTADEWLAYFWRDGSRSFKHRNSCPTKSWDASRCRCRRYASRSSRDLKTSSGVHQRSDPGFLTKRNLYGGKASTRTSSARSGGRSQSTLKPNRSSYAWGFPIRPTRCSLRFRFNSRLEKTSRLQGIGTPPNPSNT